MKAPPRAAVNAVPPGSGARRLSRLAGRTGAREGLLSGSAHFFGGADVAINGLRATLTGALQGFMEMKKRFNALITE